jgi:predicted amidohydrolase
MHELAWCAGGGLLGGALAAAARRVPVLGWVALAPVGLAVARCGPSAALAGGLFGAIVSGVPVSTPTLRKLLPITTLPSGALWAATAALAGFLLRTRDPAWLLLALPAIAVVSSSPPRLLGAPRWVHSPLACTQERWLPAVHLARVGNEQTTTTLLALASAALVLALPTPAASPIAAAIGAALVLAILGAAYFGMRQAERRLARAPRVRVAAVVVDGPPPPPGSVSGAVPTSADRRDLEDTERRYAPHVEAAAADGATLIVLPEAAITVDAAGYEAWMDVIGGWARRLEVTIVAPFFEVGTPRNSLCVVDPSGVVFTYDKLHPARGLEPEPTARMAPGPQRSPGRAWALSAVICVDLDYGDLVAPVRAAGGVLCVPANDWFGGFEELHHETAVWAAVRTGVTVVRATGHGVSAIYDGAGRVLARASSERGAVVLVADAPVG